MKLLVYGRNISSVEVANISPHGIWLQVRGTEYFLSYEEHPWFQNARLADLYEVRLIHGRFLRWDTLDVDLALDSLDHPDRYPLKYHS